MSSAEALKSASSSQLADQQVDDGGPPLLDGCSSTAQLSSDSAPKPCDAAAKPSRVFKMSDEFLMFKFKVSSRKKGGQQGIWFAQQLRHSVCRSQHFGKSTGCGASSPHHGASTLR
jgi:hypothetical protein